MTAPKKKPIEVAPPLEAINKATGAIFFFERRAHFPPGGR
jgi:hypothetical protein